MKEECGFVDMPFQESTPRLNKNLASFFKGFVLLRYKLFNYTVITTLWQTHSGECGKLTDVKVSETFEADSARSLREKDRKQRSHGTHFNFDN